jgi:hypothetical protein
MDWFERSLGLVMPDTRIASVYRDVENNDSKVDVNDWLRTLCRNLRCQKYAVFYIVTGKGMFLKLSRLQCQQAKAF